jgi:hypothetical protein
MPTRRPRRAKTKNGAVLIAALMDSAGPDPPSHPWDRYHGAKKWGWYLDDLDGWREMLATEAPIKALEVGAFDGVSANLMLDLLFTHPQSEIHAIDPYLADPTTPEVGDQTRECFEENCRIGGHEDQVKLYEGISAEVLAELRFHLYRRQSSREGRLHRRRALLEPFETRRNRCF